MIFFNLVLSFGIFIIHYFYFYRTDEEYDIDKIKNYQDNEEGKKGESNDKEKTL